MKKRIIVSLLCASMVFSMLAGCGESGSGESSDESNTSEESAKSAADTDDKDSPVTEPTKIKFVFADGDEGAKAAMNEIVSKFNDTYKDITVEIEPGNGGAYSEFLKTKDSVGEFPDVMEMRDTAIYVRANKLEPLPDEITSLFKSTMKFDDKVYTAPMASENPNGIIYNKAYFKENNLEEPKTYDDFIALCKEIQKKGDMSPLVVGGQDIWHMGFWFHKAYSDQVLSQDPDFIKHCYEGSKDFSDETVKKTFEEIKEIMTYAQDGWSSTPDAQITTFLVNKMSAMMYSGTHMFKQIEAADPNFEYGWFPVPSPDGKLRMVGGAGIGGLAISAEAAKDPNKKAAAEAFIKFFFEPDVYKVFCEKMSAIPLTKADVDIDVSPAVQTVMDTLDKADSYGPMWNGLSGENELPPDFRNFVYKTVIEVLQGSRDIDSACEEMNKTWDVAKNSFNPVTNVGLE